MGLVRKMVWANKVEEVFVETWLIVQPPLFGNKLKAGDYTTMCRGDPAPVLPDKQPWISHTPEEAKAQHDLMVAMVTDLLAPPPPAPVPALYLALFTADGEVSAPEYKPQPLHDGSIVFPEAKCKWGYITHAVVVDRAGDRVPGIPIITIHPIIYAEAGMTTQIQLNVGHA